MNVLFLGGAKRVSLANHFIAAARRIGRDATIFSYELDENVPIASVGRVIVGKRWRDADVVGDLEKCVNQHAIDIVLPFVDPAIKVCACLKTKCPRVFIPVSDIELCETMFDKVRSASWFDEHNIPQPRFFKSLEEFKYPVILKPRDGSASRGIMVCKTKDGVPKVDLTGYLCSEYIEDRTEYSVDCYVSQPGDITSIVPRVRIEASGGEVVKSVTVRDQGIIEISRKILSSGIFRGPITIQFLRDNSTGKVLVMEINPRFGGGVVTSIGAGSGIVDMLLSEALGEAAKPVFNWGSGVLMTRYFQEVIFPCK